MTEKKRYFIIFIDKNSNIMLMILIKKKYRSYIIFTNFHYISLKPPVDSKASERRMRAHPHDLRMRCVHRACLSK